MFLSRLLKSEVEAEYNILKRLQIFNIICMKSYHETNAQRLPFSSSSITPQLFARIAKLCLYKSITILCHFGRRRSMCFTKNSFDRAITIQAIIRLGHWQTSHHLLLLLAPGPFNDSLLRNYSTE